MDKKFYKLLINQNRTTFIVLAIPILLYLLIAIAYVLLGEVDFDEGFNLQIPASLIKQGSYSTTYDGGRDFDPVITTGPTVLLPIFALFKMLNIGLYEARFVMFLYFLGMILSVLFVSNKLGGTLGSITSLILLGSLPLIFYFGLRIFGEIPAILFLLLGIIALERGRLFISGIFIGMSVLTKITFLIVVFPVVLLLVIELLSNSHHHPRTIVRYYLWFLLGFVLPNVGWELVKLISLGIVGYVENLRGLLNLFLSSSGIHNTVATASTQARIETLSQPFTYIPPLLVLIILLLILFHNVFLVWNSYQQNGWSRVSRMHLFLVVFSTVYLFWFLISANAGWWRHILPGFILITILTGSSLAAFIKWVTNYFLGKFTEKSICLSILWSSIAVIIFIGFGFIIIEPAYAQSLRIKNELNNDLLNNQIELANKISELSNDGGLIGYWGWWQSPEISFLSQADFFDINKSKTLAMFDQSLRNGIDAYVLIAPAQRISEPEIWHQEMFYCGELIFETNGYQLFTYIPGDATTAQLQYLRKRGVPITGSTYTFGPESTPHTYSGTGIYIDGWMAQKANVWFEKGDNQKKLLIRGNINLDFFNSDEILVRVYVMDSLIQEKVINRTGDFQWLIGLPNVYSSYDVLKVSLIADQFFVPSNLGINNDPRELSIMIKEISLQ
jgi:hypothetical protein